MGLIISQKSPRSHGATLFMRNPGFNGNRHNTVAHGGRLTGTFLSDSRYKNFELIMFGNNQIEDVRWLCSLSETELDMLIWIKRMVLHRAEKIGHKSLAQEFDLRTLRCLSVTMMEHLMDQLKDLRVHPSYAEAMRGLGGSNLSRSHVNSDFFSMSPEELWAYVCPEKKKRIAEMLADDEPLDKRPKTVDGEQSGS